MIGQVLFGWTGEDIQALVIGEILGSETGFLDPFNFAGWMGLLVEGVVLEIVLHLVCFEIGIILFAAVSRIA